ncbi:sodium-dependent transporter [Shewanella sp. WXL01]|uniref:sodium-dependent transporter n=1 Tax=Shewanella sp. WXL01 TaxID=2709721 RepID=UPI0014382C9E|nr:sodium-dependent transporter [Shewanella sp. WXL01]NKF50435.1 sodium-dependent transporter [Shewanella sp. WXL01]
MATNSQAQFSSKIGFIMAAAGSAVGVGNIWGFPTQAATHGGGAFLLMYIVLILLLGYPMLMAELMVGRHGQTNPADAMAKLSSNKLLSKLGGAIGFGSIITATLICTFYCILSGWFISHAIAPVAQMAEQPEVANWLMEFSVSRNLVFTLIFTALVIMVIRQGVQQGIERWSKRLMPLLLLMLVLGSIYILFQPGAMTGLKQLLIPDFSRVLDTDVLVSALGQTFFSLTVGTGAMMVYGAYLNKKDNLAKLTGYVTLTDTLVAFLAALMIIPAMYVAQHQGVQIFADDGSLLNSDTLVFTVLPALFESLGGITQYILAIVFFILMTIAGLTSAMSIVEVPTSYLVEKTKLNRNQATLYVGLFIALVASLIVFNFSSLFGAIITLTTERAQPLIALGIAIFLGWVWRRNSLIEAISAQDGVDTSSLFWKIWPIYVKYICPLLILVIIAQLFTA